MDNKPKFGSHYTELDVETLMELELWKEDFEIFGDQVLEYVFAMLFQAYGLEKAKELMLNYVPSMIEEFESKFSFEK